jgi:LAO/AO transport system kinase
MSEWAQKIRGGDLRALARAASGVENRNPAALALLREMEAAPGHARIVGITGPPGAGKSTLVDAMVSALRRQGKTIAVIAVDPTSHITGGAILGDRIRMSRHYADSGIFIRSMATRGSVGGLAAATRDLALLMDAAGRDYVIVETVGVGQDEIEIAGLAGVTVVVQAPGMGDDVQALKAGILEIADVFAINKADQPGADRVEHELRAALSLAEGPHPPIVRTVATEGEGIAELLAAIEALPDVAQARMPAVSRFGMGAEQPLTGTTLAAEAGAPEDSETGAAAGQPTRTSQTAPADVAQALLPAVSRFVSTLVGGGDQASPAAEASAPSESRLQPISSAPQSGATVEMSLDTASQTACATEQLQQAIAFYAAPGLRPTPVPVPGLGAVADQLRASGGRLLNQPPEGAESHLYIFVDPVLLELIQESAS